MYFKKTKVAETDKVSVLSVLSVLELRLDICMMLLLFFKQPVQHIQAITIIQRI